MRLICFSIALFASIFGWSQNEGLNPSYFLLETNTEKDVSQSINTTHLFSSYKITTLDSVSVNCTITAGNKSRSITVYPEIGPQETSSGFGVLSRPSQKISIKTNLNSKLKVEFFYAPEIEIVSTNLKYKSSNCRKPSTIARSQWRKGLPAPKPGRTRTTVKHCVIHHTAGSNSDTNYVNTIRNIYLYHTQSNGWDDIGYNYVIAQDGTIFEGRDPLGIDEEDNIQGAHFCSKNGGTMGISLMGDYEIATPSDTMLSSLNKLIAWKLHKENIDPMDSFLHPNSLGEYLHTVTMHRAGCATLCPGENVANKLADIQREVNELVDDCNNFAGIDKTELSSKLYIYPNPAGREIFIKLNDEMKFSTYRIISPSGLEVQSGILSISGRIKLETPTGLHYLLLESSAGDIYREKIVVMNP